MAPFRPTAARQIEYDVKYAGYVARQEIDVARQQRMADKRIPAAFDFAAIAQLRTEAREKLCLVRPLSLAQASRISGITPADMALLLVHLEGGGSATRLIRRFAARFLADFARNLPAKTVSLPFQYDAGNGTTVDHA